MTKEEIKKRVDECMEDFFKKFKNATKEEAEWITMWLQVACFKGNAITEEDLIECANYLGYELDLEKIKQDKIELLKDLEEKEKTKKKQRRYVRKGGKVYVKN